MVEKEIPIPKGKERLINKSISKTSQLQMHPEKTGTKIGKIQWITITLGLGLIFSMFAASGLGAISISLGEMREIISHWLGFSALTEVPSNVKTIWMDIRIPRIIMSVMVGAALSYCGAALQGLFRNPLADPGIIGISSGAALAASIAIVFMSQLSLGYSFLQGSYLLSISAFVGALLTTVIVLGIANYKNTTNVAILLLCGIALNALTGAFTGVLIYLADDAQLRSITFWTLGSLAGAGWSYNIMMLIALAISMALIFPMHKSLDALSLGEKEAAYLGISLNQLKYRIVIGASIAVGVSVAFCGMIGFVGLVVPHMIRLVNIANNRVLLRLSALLGGLLLCWADTLSRTIALPAEIPIGIVTSLVGAPVFLFLLMQQKRDLI